MLVVSHVLLLVHVVAASKDLRSASSTKSPLGRLFTMPFSHHSHSGEFCGHAKNTLEEVVQTAIAKKMQVYALTEHMPREDQDLYPEEVGP